MKGNVRMTTPENDLKKAIRDYLKSEGIYRVYIPGTAYGDVGAPDIVACHKGKFIGIEAKVGTNKLSKWQEKHKRGILASNGIHIEARSVDDVRMVIESLDN